MKPALFLVAALSAGIAAPALAFSQPVPFPPTIDIPPITMPHPDAETQDTTN